MRFIFKNRIQNVFIIVSTIPVENIKHVMYLLITG